MAASLLRDGRRLGVWGSLCAGASLSAACAGEAPYVADQDVGSTHALISVERSKSASSAETPARAAVLAGFVRVPATVDGSAALAMVGLELPLPELGRCASRDALQTATASPAPADPVELVPVGDVSVLAGGAPTTLAPRAFPTVTDLVSGVVYTTRDVAADPLPPDAAYQVRTAGSAALEPLVVSGQAPRELGQVTVSGTSLGDVRTIPTVTSIPLAWAPGDAGDLLMVELSATGAPVTVCAFRDQDGIASIPGGAFAGRGAGRLTLHRIRSQALETSSIQSGELRFDFELAADVTYE